MKDDDYVMDYFGKSFVEKLLTNSGAKILFLVGGKLKKHLADIVGKKT